MVGVWVGMGVVSVGMNGPGLVKIVYYVDMHDFKSFYKHHGVGHLLTNLSELL